MSEAAVYLRNGNKSYDQNNKILNDFSMTVPKGSIYGLLGASGCGKTTLLNCIVGRNNLNSGELWVLGGKPGTIGSGVPGPKVGYMPQDVALCSEFTVKEAVYFFGRLAQMDDDLIQTRYEELKKLLDLPPNTRYLNDCSGGQQRRVSFACALIQKPELLILDEPTAGVDPLLRNKIWNFLKEITETEKTTVIITTHYIEETRTADMIGLMRGGKLLAEAPPTLILKTFQVETLEEVFLILSQKQEMENPDTSIHVTGDNNFNMKKITENLNINLTKEGLFPSMNIQKPELKENGNIRQSAIELNKKRLIALLDKNWKQFYRNVSGWFFLLVILPVLCSLLFVWVIGSDVKDVRVIIVNEESTCIDQSKTIINNTENGTCYMRNLSCRFLKFLEDDPSFDEIYSDTINDALNGVRRAEYVGALHISKNHSLATEKRLYFGRNTDNETLKLSEIKVYMDMSDYVKGYNIERKLIEIYQKYLETILKDCEYLTGSNRFMNFEYIYGDINTILTEDMVPGYFLTLTSYLATMMTSHIIISERLGGVWDRIAVAGVTVTEIIFTHFLLQFFVMALQAYEIYYVMFIYFGINMVGSNWIAALMVLLQGISGMCYGFLVSIISYDNYFTANVMVSGGFYPMVLICGIFWPMDGQPAILKFISKLTPFSIPSESFRYVMRKGWDLNNYHVLKGVGVEIFWIILLGIICIYSLKNKQ